MCRWFAYVSENEDCLLEDVLITPAHGITKQVHDHYLPKLIHHSPTGDDAAEKENKVRNLLFNIDGTGICWYTSAKSDFIPEIDGLRPAMYKTISPPANDLNMKSICANTHTTVVFAHIRAASGTAITPINNHPFIFGRHTFMHNGSVSNFTSIRRALCELLDADTYANVLGSTDSEHVAALYITYLTQGRGKASWEEEYTTDAMADALYRAIGTIISLQNKILGSGARPNSLNLATTDGRRLVSVRFRNSKVENPPSLYYSTSAGITLNRRYPGHPNEGVVNTTAVKTAEEHGTHVIVASEPSTYQEDQWELIGKNQCLLVERNGDVKVEDIPYDKNWDAEDPDY